MGGRSGQLASDLVGRVREEVSGRASRNRFVDQLEADGAPRERLAWLAGENPREAVRAALALHAYEIAFWDALADGFG